MLDLKTLMILYLITNVINAGAIAIIWGQNRSRFPGLLFILIAFLLQVLGPSLHILRGTLPDLITMTFSNTLILGGFIFLMIGLERFTGKRSRQIPNFILLAFFVLISAYFVVIQPNLRVRDIALSSMLIIYSAQCAILLFSSDQSLRRITRTTGIVLLIYAIFSLARIISTFSLPEISSDFFKSGAVNEIAITGYIILNVCLTVSIILMVSRRLLSEVITQEKKFNLAFQTSPYAITITRLTDGKFIEINDAFTEITGYTREEAMADSSIGLNLWTDADNRRQVVSTLMEGRKIAHYEYLFNKKNGEVITGLFSAQVMQLNDESYILSSINNITERKKMEEELRNEQQFSASLIDSLPGIFYLYSYPELRLVRYNKNHEVFLGFDPDELKGLSVRDWNIQDSRMPVINAMEEAMKTGSVRIEANLNTKDGRTIPFILTGVRLDIRDKSYIMGMGIDITSLKAAEEEISIKNTELLKLNAEKDKFFSIIAHDLRSPFNALLGFTTIIAEELPSLEPDEIQKIALTLRDSAANVYNLLENLLEWSVIQIGLKSFNKEPFSLKSKIYDSSELIEVSALQKNINISSDIPDNLEMVADGNMVGTVIRNLLSNAVKFTKNGGKIKIEAKLLNENEIQISVSDTGIGLSKDRLDRLFNIHEKTNRQGTNGEHSTGLGLIICKDLIEKNGGMIWAESEVDKGSTFYVKLPAR